MIDVQGSDTVWMCSLHRTHRTAVPAVCTRNRSIDEQEEAQLQERCTCVSNPNQAQAYESPALPS